MAARTRRMFSSSSTMRTCATGKVVARIAPGGQGEEAAPASAGFARRGGPGAAGRALAALALPQPGLGPLAPPPPGRQVLGAGRRGQLGEGVAQRRQGDDELGAAAGG